MDAPASPKPCAARRPPRHRLAILTAGALALACQPAPDASEALQTEVDDGWTELFNGRDLTGWVPKIRGEPPGRDARGTFRVQDGLLSVSYDGYDAEAGFDDTFGHLFWAEPLEGYELRIEYRFVGRQFAGGPDWARSNSGVMFHAQAPGTMGLGQDFPVSLEAQFLGGVPDEVRPTANLCTPGTHVDMDGAQVTEHCIEADAPTLPDSTWVTVFILASADGSVRHVLDGDTVLAYERPVVGGGAVSGATEEAPAAGTLLRRGYIALQSESHPIQFRRVAVRRLGGG